MRRVASRELVQVDRDMVGGGYGVRPENIEVSLRQKEGFKVYVLLNHQNSQIRIQFYKPMHDFLTGQNIVGNYDLPPHGVLVIDEHPETKSAGVLT